MPDQNSGWEEQKVLYLLLRDVLRDHAENFLMFLHVESAEQLISLTRSRVLFRMLLRNAPEFLPSENDIRAIADDLHRRYPSLPIPAALEYHLSENVEAGSNGVWLTGANIRFYKRKQNEEAR